MRIRACVRRCDAHNAEPRAPWDCPSGAGAGSDSLSDLVGASHRGTLGFLRGSGRAGEQRGQLGAAVGQGAESAGGGWLGNFGGPVWGVWGRLGSRASGQSRRFPPSAEQFCNTLVFLLPVL